MQPTVSTISERKEKTVSADEKKTVQLDFIKKNPILASTINILVPEKENRNSGKDKRDAIIKSARATTLFSTLTTVQSQRIRDAELIKKHLTDLKLVENILISSILSPKDLVKTELSYNYAETTTLPPAVAGEMLSIIRDHFKTGYKIEDLLSSILSESLFRSGSDPFMVLPESAMDQLINGEDGAVSLESYTDRAKQLLNTQILDGTDKRNIKKGKSIISKNNGFMDLLLDASPKPDKKTEHSEKYKEHEFKISLENDLLIDVTDNLELLKLPKLLKKTAEMISMEAYYENGNEDLDISLEAMALKLSSDEVISQEAGNEAYGFIPVDTFMVGGRERNKGEVSEIAIVNDSGSRPNIGHPTVIRWPAEAIFPIKTPGDKNKPAGFFAVIDESGHPVTMDLTAFYLRNLTGTNVANNSGSLNNSSILNSASLNKWGINGDTDTLRHEQYLYAQRLYSSLAEAKILEDIRDGVYGEDIEINAKQEIFKIMFARTLANKRTRLVFIPNTLMTYFSFFYDENGLGVSLIELNKEIETQRVAIDYALSLANLKAAIPQYKLDIELDELEQDPEEAIDMMIHNWVKSQRATNVFNIGNPADTITNVILFGAKVNVADHPNYPKVEFSAESSIGNNAIPDTAWSEKLEERNHMGFGVPSEIIKSFSGTDFATTAVLDNLMLMKTATELSNKFVPQIRSFIINYTLASGTLMKELAEVLKKHVGELQPEDKKIPIKRRIKMFMDEIEIGLPMADTKYAETMKDQISNFVSTIEEIVDKAMGNDYIIDSDILGEDADQLDRYKNYIKAYLIRDYMISNNIIPSLTNILTNPVEDMNFFVDGALQNSQDMKKILSYIKSKVAEAVGSNDENTDNSKVDEAGNPVSENLMAEAGVDAGDVSDFGTNTDYQTTQGRNDGGWSINGTGKDIPEDVNPEARPD